MHKIIAFDNYKFSYYLRENKNFLTILFLHGFMENAQDFEPVMSFLSEQFCCLAIDLPGHGKTEVTGRDECYTMPNTAEAIIKLLNKLNIEKCFLIGYSMGGRLALYLTLKFPERFYKIVLESASPGLKTKEERLKRTENDHKLADELETIRFDDFLIKWYDQPLFTSLKEKPGFEKILQDRLNNNPFELAKSLRNLSLGVQPSLWDGMKYNKIPILLLVGERDEKFKMINTDMATGCKSHTLKIISNTGHNIHRENIMAFVEEIQKFFIDKFPKF